MNIRISNTKIVNRTMNRAPPVSRFCIVILFFTLKGQSFVPEKCRLRTGTFIQKTRPSYPLFEIYAVKDPNAKKEGRKLTPAQKAIKKSIGAELNEFDKIKQVAYGAVDGFKNFGGSTDEKISKSLVVDGYSDLRKQRTPNENLKKVKTDPSEVRPTLSIFESVKGVVYGTADAASSLGKMAKDNDPKIIKEKLPVKGVLSKELIEANPDLKSANPIKRLVAEAKMKDMEIKEKARMKQKEIQDRLDKVKETVYTAGDVINETVETAKEIPGKVTKLVEETSEFIASVPGTVQKTVDEVTAIPAKIEQKAVEVKRSVETTVENTKKFINDVKAIPSKIQKTVDNTKKTVDRTVKAVEEVQTNTKVILGIEKPKPKPPKTPPPKPPTAGDIAFKALGTVASTAFKGVLWVGKGAADLSIKAAMKGFEAVKESVEKQQAASRSLPTPPKPVSSVKQTQSQKDNPESTKDEALKIPLQTTLQDNPAEKIQQTKVNALSEEEVARRNDVINTDDLERQVAEALKLAENALDSSTSQPEKEVITSNEKTAGKTKTKKKKPASAKKSKRTKE